MLAKVYVTLKEGVLDPQGAAVLHSLKTLGYDEVKDVRMGRYIEIRLDNVGAEDAKQRLDEMCQKLLSNMVIESYRFELCK